MNEALASFWISSAQQFQDKYKTPVKIHNTSLPQQSLILNDTDKKDLDDPTSKKIPDVVKILTHYHTLMTKTQNRFEKTITESTSLLNHPSYITFPKKIQVDGQEQKFNKFFDPSFFKYQVQLEFFYPQTRFLI